MAGTVPFQFKHRLGLCCGERLCCTDPPFPVVVVGGARADMPLDPGRGAAVRRLLGTEPMACVVDVSDFGSATSRRAFMTAFMSALYEANTEPLDRGPG